MQNRLMIGINGSPRKDKSTAMLVEKALEGIASHGVKTELVNLYDLNIKGCQGCYNCKILGGKSYGMCALKDDLSPVIRKIRESDGLIIGSPIYFSTITAGIKALLERLYFPLFQYISQDSFFFREIPTGFIFCLNEEEEAFKNTPTYEHLHVFADYAKRLTGPTQVMFACNTSQHDDYSKYYDDNDIIEARIKHHQSHFPDHCRKAYEMGERLVQDLK